MSNLEEVNIKVEDNIDLDLICDIKQEIQEESVDPLELSNFEISRNFVKQEPIDFTVNEDSNINSACIINVSGQSTADNLEKSCSKEISRDFSKVNYVGAWNMFCGYAKKG